MWRVKSTGLVKKIASTWGDFAGGVLKYLRKHPIPKLTIAGGIGKMTKLAQGASDLHSGRSQVDFATLADMTDNAEVAGANTALEAYEMCGAPMADAIARQAQANALQMLNGAEVAVEIIVIDRAGNILAKASFA